MALSVKQFRDCCGIRVLSAFEMPSPWGKTEAAVLKEAENALKGLEAASRKVGSGRQGLTLIALNHEQRQLYWKLLKGYGWKVIVDRFYNPNSENLVTLYGRTHYQDNNHEVF